MARIEWHDDMRTGIDVLDADHQKILTKLNNIVEMVNLGSSKDAIDEAVHLSVIMVAHITNEIQELQKLSIDNYDDVLKVQESFKNQGCEISKLLVSSPADGVALAEALAKSFSSYLMTCGKLLRKKIEQGKTV